VSGVIVGRPRGTTREDPVGVRAAMTKLGIAMLLGAVAFVPACNSDSCVAEGAEVSTPQGLRPIESLRIGDEIWAVDPKTGERVATRIVAIKTATRECLALELQGGGALVCTPDHPVYAAESSTFVPAVSFLEGKARQILRVDEEGARVQDVRVVRANVGLRRVFDLTVESEHHDFVADGVLVHNKSDPNECGPYPDCIASTSGDTSTSEESTDEASTSADSGTESSGTDDTGSSDTGSGSDDTGSSSGDTGSSSGDTGSSSGSSSGGA
jgi:hypothetical protein